MALKGINHVVLKVRELERAEAFYRLLGFQRSGSRPDMRMRFFRADEGHHHHLALIEVGAGAPAPAREAVGLFHFCVTVSDEAELGRLRNALVAAGHRVSEGVDHIVSRSIYTRDPDGNTVELTWDVPAEEWADIDNPFLVDRPYEPPAPPEEERGA